MRYLCSTHQSQLFAQSFEQQSSIWLDWMMRAAVFYQQRYWQDALPFLGCGFELSMHQLEAAQKDEQAAAVTLCLSAIYLHNVLRHLGQTLEAQALVHQTIDAIAAHGSLIDGDGFIRLLVKPHLHQAFFTQYLNLPYQELPASALSLH